MSDDEDSAPRAMCFTLHNYTPINLEYIERKWPKIASYYVYGFEICPTTGTPHLQGYVEWNSSKKFSTCHKMFNGRAMWKLRYEHSNAAAAATYCKKDGDFVEWGTISRQGARTDLKTVMSAIDAGMPEIDVFERFPHTAMRYLKGFDRYRLLCQKRSAKGYHKKNVIVHWGDTGTGKTRSAIEQFPDAFIVVNGITGFWWDGYDGEKVVIMDDFRGNCMPLATLLTILDGYAAQVSVRGGSRILSCHTIFITSNVSPLEWYPNADERSMAAVLRRIDRSHFFDKNGKGKGVILDPLTPNEKEEKFFNGK